MLNDIFKSFFRTLGRIIAYLFVAYILMLLFGQINAKASVYNANDFEIRVNNTLVMGNDGGGLWDGGYATISSGNEVNMEIVVNNVGDKAGDNLLVTVTFCSTGTYYGSILTPGYDLTGATLINNYSIQHSNTACKVGGYDGVVMQSIWNLSVPGNSFSLHSWGGIRDNYTVLVDVTGITISDFDPSMAQEFQQYQQNQTIIDQNNQLINGFGNLQNQQQETNDKLDDLNDSISSDSDDTTSGSCGIICKLKGIFTGIVELPVKLVNLLIDALKSLFIPEDTDFITNFVESIESKLGFIAEVPVQIIEFGINLASAGWEEVTSVSLPSISIFGYNFWSSQEIDISEGLKVFQAFRYITDCLCVIICARGLIKLWEGFTGGDSN